MKGVILAAGDGSRLDPLTRSTPKPLIAVAGHPMVTYPMRALVHKGVTELIIVVGHLGDRIRQVLGESGYRGARLTYVESSDHEDGNGLSLYAAREAIGEEHDEGVAEDEQHGRSQATGSDEPWCSLSDSHSYPP